MYEDAMDLQPPLVAENTVKKKFKPDVTLEERAHHTPEDAVKLLKYSKSDYYGIAVWLAWLVGLRTEAIMASRIDRVDFLKKELLIDQCYKRKTKKIDPLPKSKKPQRIPIPEVLVDYLRSVTMGRSADSFVIEGKRNKMVSYNTLLRNFKRLCAEAEVLVITPHEGRHSTSELWCDNGANLEDIRRLLGQTKSDTTQRYMHRSDNRLKKIAKGVAKDLLTKDSKGGKDGKIELEESDENVIMFPAKSGNP